MKYDLSGKVSRSAGRALSAFSEALFALLEKRAFEDVTVRELCNQANYPRSTFYNYFDDIYDLMDYCWEMLLKGMGDNHYEGYPAEQRMYLLFHDLYAEFEKRRDALNRIFKVNKAGGKLMESIGRHMKRSLTATISEDLPEGKSPIPAEMLAEHCSNIIQLVFEWSFLREDGLSREAATDALRYLIGGPYHKGGQSI